MRRINIFLLTVMTLIPLVGCKGGHEAEPVREENPGGEVVTETEVDVVETPTPVVMTFDALVSAGAKIDRNQDGSVKSIDLSAISEPVLFDPSEIDSLKSLRVLRGKGIVADGLGEQLAGHAPDLTEFLWTETTISDSSLKGMATLPKLKKARLAGITLTPETTAILATWPALADLDLSTSTLTDEDLDPLAGMGGLTRLNLYQTKVTDAGVEKLRPIAGNLVWFNLDNTLITDGVGESLSRFENLTFLHIGRDNVTDALVDSLAKLTKLEKIHVTRTEITPEGVAKLAEALPETEIISVVEEK